MVFVIAMQELLIDMVAHAARHGTDELSDKWKQTTAYSLGSARVVWQSFLDDGLVQQAKPASNAHIVQWSEKQVEEFSDKRVRREIEQLTHRSRAEEGASGTRILTMAAGHGRSGR